MTPQEKSEQLVSMYLLATPIGFHIEDAKKCAIIAVNEMIQIANEAMLFKQSKREWLKEVKTEIEKL
jgi:hypothetical protein